LPKSVENVSTMLAASILGASFVPINPILKSDQVMHILRDSGARVLVTSQQRLAAIESKLANAPAIDHIVLIDATPSSNKRTVTTWADLVSSNAASPRPYLEDNMAAIFYTSGSTGRPKGVVLSHRNIVTGGLSVSEYLQNDSDDRILSLLP